MFKDLELTPKQTEITKGAAIMMMLFVHLFCNDFYKIDLYQPLIFIGETPLVFYLSLFTRSTRAIYCFCSGYGLYKSFSMTESNYMKRGYIRIVKLVANYWIVLLLFIVVGVAFGSTVIPGNWTRFFLNFFGLSHTYNGAWNFFMTYILLILLSKQIFLIVKKYNSAVVIIISLALWFGGFYYDKIPFLQQLGSTLPGEVLLSKVSLLLISQFNFVIGALFAEKKWISKIYGILSNVKRKNLVAILGIAVIVVVEAIFPIYLLMVVLSIPFIILFNWYRFSPKSMGVLSFLSRHSTNMWLVHMFFSWVIFKYFVFSATYPVLIYLLLFALSLGSSFIIKIVLEPVIQFINKRVSTN